jgi:general secretion pathway protein D
MASGRRFAVALLLAAALAAEGCAAQMAYRRGQREAKKGDWDLAVARFTLAVQKDRSNIGYKIALENARIRASREHHTQARKHLAADELDKALEELEISTRFDPGDKTVADDMATVKERIAARAEQKRRLSDFEAMKGRVQVARAPVPVLSPRDTTPISLKLVDQSLEKALDTLGKLAGVNIVFDQDYRDKPKVSVQLAGVTFEQALDQITMTNRLFYKVVDQNTVIVVPETTAKRRSYDELLLRTFYLENAEPKALLQVIKQVVPGTAVKAEANESLSALTVLGTPEQLAVVERVVSAHDKGRGEVLAEIEILEVDRNRLKKYGIELSNYEISSTFSPTGAEGEVAGGFTNVRAHVLSSLNLADFVVTIPSTLFARFLQTESTVKILAAPRLRATEGKPTGLKIGTEVPVPMTTYTAFSAGVSSFAPATSFQYRNVGVTLQLTPKVNARGEITLEMEAEFSALGDDRNVGTGQNPLVVPTFLTRSIKGTLRVRDGETSLIGGLIQGREAETFKGVIGLQSIPLLNKLFTSAQKSGDESEIIISITPHLLRAPRLVDEDLKPLYVGTSERPNVPGARPPLFGPPEAPAGASEPQAASPAGVQTPPRVAPRVGPAPAAPVPAPGPESSEKAPPEGPAPPVTSPLRQLTAAFAPPEITVRSGATGTLSLVVLGARDVVSASVVLTFDSSVVRAKDVRAGALLTMDGAAVGVERNLELGRITAKLVRAKGIEGAGAVAVVEFEAVQPGQATIAVEALSVTTSTETISVPAVGGSRISVVP